MAGAISKKKLIENAVSAARAEASRELRESGEHDFSEDQRDDNEYADWFGPTGALGAPSPRKGMEQRWIREELSGSTDPANVQKRFQQKWVPRNASTVPVNSRWFSKEQLDTGVIRVRGMILCERPVEYGEKHRAWIRSQTQAQKHRVANDLERSSYVMKGMRPFVAEDKTKVGNVPRNITPAYDEQS